MSKRRSIFPQSPPANLRLQAFGVTEPTSGSDTTQLKTTAVRRGDLYIVNGKKVFISRVEHSDLLLLLARTTPADEVAKRTEGLSVFLIDLREAVGNGLTVSPIRTMINHHTCELFFDDLEVPAENLVGEEGRGFRYILDGWNAERILIAAECIGDGRWFIERACDYAGERVVFDRPIGKNQGVQFPIARAHAHVEAADLMRLRAAWLFDEGKSCGPEANMAKLLAADASWEAANVALDTHGGFGFAADYDIERKFRETRLYQIAPRQLQPHPRLHRRARSRSAAVLLISQNPGFTLAQRKRASPKARPGQAGDPPHFHRVPARNARRSIETSRKASPRPPSAAWFRGSAPSG